MMFSLKVFNRTFVAILLVLTTHMAYADPLRIGSVTVDLPSNTDSSWILRDVRQNGVHTNLVGLTFYYQPQQKIKEHFSRYFSKNGHYREAAHDGWIVLSQKRQHRFISLQLKTDDSTTVGMLTVSNDIREQLDVTLNSLRLPVGFQVLNLVQDGHSETATLTASKSVDSAAKLLTTALVSQGWERREHRRPSVNVIRMTFTNADSGNVSLFLAKDAAWGNITMIYLNRSKRKS